jgi:hypothetical protein
MSRVALVERGSLSTVGRSDAMLLRTWLDDVAQAISDNVVDPDVMRLGSYGSASLEARARALSLLELSLPYRFEGPSHVIASLAAARRRGSGACTEAAALAAAVGLWWGVPVSLCIELDASQPGYSHVRTMWHAREGELVIDPYARHAAGLNTCATLYDVRIVW